MDILTKKVELIGRTLDIFKNMTLNKNIKMEIIEVEYIYL